MAFIFWFEQLLFSKVDKLTCKGQVGLGLAGKGRWRANTGWSQLIDVIGSSHATSIKIWDCPCKLCQPYCYLPDKIQQAVVSLLARSHCFKKAAAPPSQARGEYQTTSNSSGLPLVLCSCCWCCVATDNDASDTKTSSKNNHLLSEQIALLNLDCAHFTLGNGKVSGHMPSLSERD